MKVKDLIKLLAKMPQDDEVILFSDEEGNIIYSGFTVEQICEEDGTTKEVGIIPTQKKPEIY